MQFTTFIAAAAALAFGANANVTPRDGARLAQFRIFGADGCHDQNMGFYTVDESDASECHEFRAAVKSINLEAMEKPAADGCNLFVYTNNICNSGEQSLSLNTCIDVPPPDVMFSSWKIVCSGL
ncbi:uncharacterized protein F4812DRAFT_13577 [Daldinia caldariorum]|uniref:uncharacterized protein n=1 Tax=Daldinia caldariorum TaxID=326644 RepID=UPI002007D3E2|nr:uncharacterized protein F4812DRAFT_13577 [Daldinia caldariorum]KAI1472458.1 hypothetical protein F4812DRAFT_13577 [Daldinia caldariorum]